MAISGNENQRQWHVSMWHRKQKVIKKKKLEKENEKK